MAFTPFPDQHIFDFFLNQAPNIYDLEHMSRHPRIEDLRANPVFVNHVMSRALMVNDDRFKRVAENLVKSDRVVYVCDGFSCRMERTQ